MVKLGKLNGVPPDMTSLKELKESMKILNLFLKKIELNNFSEIL